MSNAFIVVDGNSVQLIPRQISLDISNQISIQSIWAVTSHVVMLQYQIQIQINAISVIMLLIKFFSTKK